MPVSSDKCLAVEKWICFYQNPFLFFLELPAWSRPALGGSWILQDQTSSQMLNSFMVVISPQRWQIYACKSILEKSFAKLLYFQEGFPIPLPCWKVLCKPHLPVLVKYLRSTIPLVCFKFVTFLCYISACRNKKHLKIIMYSHCRKKSDVCIKSIYSY